ncbi:hypothetical protein B9Z55_015767 [Caenorhabditis nigoni]|uniref:Uncharacterized protein n=2 Tax=Caenorhabditis nigoni TaxID=1611254 RepID=A0A2G5UBN8_9PELO|nr:hypothetical protein B9Z55_015767 [Caenorhabditis nigoni]
MNFPIFSIFLIIFLGFSKSDPLTIDVEVRCAFNQLYWCGKMHIFEHNNYPKPHDIIRSEDFCTYDVIKRFHYTDIYLQGDTSPMYEIQYQLHHNCTPDVFWRCLNSEEPVEVPKIGEYCAQLNIDAYSRGTSEECPHPNGEF